MSIKSKLVAMLAACATLAGSASAQVLNGSLAVQVTFNDHCESLVVGAMNFGAHTVVSVATPITQTATISMSCTVGTTYDIELGAGSSFGQASGFGSLRAMRQGVTSNYVAYELTSDAGYATPWGTLPGNAVAATAASTAISHTVYGRIPNQSVPAVGTYNDTVAVTVNY